VITKLMPEKKHEILMHW